MPKVTAVVGKQETEAAFEALIVVAMNLLVGNYSPPKHRAYTMQLRHGRLNRVFELASVNYQPRAEPIAHVTKRCQATAMVVAPPPLKKASEGKRQKIPSSHARDKTSE
jgi:hypothetical protein